MSTTDLAQQVADLTTATTALTQEVVGQKDRLTLAADTATGKASESSVSEANAAASASAALTSQNVATQEADRAEVAADNASQVSGLDTVDEAVEVALDARWDTALTEQGHNVLVASNLAERDYNSGFDQWGKHFDSGTVNVPINEGLWVDAGLANKLILGSNSSNGLGVSKSGTPLTCIAGVVSEILGVNSGDKVTYINKLTLEPAPDGTQQWKDGAVFDYAREVDPKYGDIASTHSEAVSRNFEGEVKNGDFRLGDNGDWSNYDGASHIISDGILTVNNVNTNGGVRQHPPLSDTVTVYIITYTLLSGAGGVPYWQYHNGTSWDSLALMEGTHSVEITVSGGGAHWYFKNDISNQSYQVSNISIHKVGNEPLTNPTDLVMLEHFDELDNDEYFPHGMIQTGLTGTWNGLPLVASIRPASYFAVFDGQYVDGNSVGTAVEYHTGNTVDSPRCIKIGSLTAEQRKVLVANAGEGFWINTDGDVIHRRVRQRSIRGGNGKWLNTDFTSGGYFEFDTASPARPQGARDDVSTSNLNRYIEPSHSSGTNAEENYQGVYQLYNNSATAGAGVNNQCFAQVLGTIPRLNQGAYHPQFNEFGTATMRNSDNPATWYNPWYNQYSILLNVSSQKDCFSDVIAVDGSIAIGRSGHPAGLLYDAIYSQGLNGFIDQRLSVQDDLDLAISKRKADDKSGETRGRELLVYTEFWTETSDATKVSKSGKVLRITSTSSGSVGRPSDFNPQVGDVWHRLDDNKTLTVKSVDAAVVFGSELNLRIDGAKWLLLNREVTNIEVSGEYSAKMVIGSVENILATDVLKDGWYGDWCPVIPDGTSKNFPISSKAIGTQIKRTWTGDNGLSWLSNTFTVDNVTNTTTANVPTTQTVITNYTAHTKHTQPSANPVVYKGEDGLGDVFVNSGSGVANGALLNETLTSSIPTGSYGGLGQFKSPALLNKSVQPQTGVISSVRGNYTLTHTDANVAAPSNDSHAVKALWGTTELNGLIYPVYWYTELIYSNGSWNDDSLIHVADNDSTMTDLDGNVVKVGCHIGVDSIGFAPQ